jgi:hypothetical protein
VKDREFKLDSFEWFKQELVEDADDLPKPEELATDAIAKLEGAVEYLSPESISLWRYPVRPPSILHHGAG